jgi:alpha-L-fucosidase
MKDLFKQFDPEKFNAEEWVKLAKSAGMKYIVITTKHHDGFCMFDTKQTDFDIMSTPFHRDVMKELAAACKKEGIQLCFYHSIMDWHQPYYFPRREWEKDRPGTGADFDVYVSYMKNQLRELLTNYGRSAFFGLTANGKTHGRMKEEKIFMDMFEAFSLLLSLITVLMWVDKTWDRQRQDLQVILVHPNRKFRPLEFQAQIGKAA